MSKVIVNHPWGESEDWSGDIEGYESTHWLSGAPRQQNLIEYRTVGVSGPEDFQDAGFDAPEVSDQQPRGSSPVYAPPPGYGAPLPSSGASFGATLAPAPENTPIDYSKVIYTGAMILMGLGSVMAAIIQYKTYQDNKERNRIAMLSSTSSR